MADRRTRVILGLDAGPYVRGLARAGAATKAFTKELDSSDSRMGNLVQTSLALGPALIPIGAAAVPAVAALTAGLGAAAGTAAVAALAFNGIGDAVKALNEYHLEPTKENLAKVREEMQKLGPAGRDFARFISSLGPEIQKLQNVAQAGLFPGLQDGIEDLMRRGPQIERIIGNIAQMMGDLGSEAGKGLAGSKFDDFFTYIETDAGPILSDFGRTIGNVTEGLANMMVGFGPMSRDFSGGLLAMSRDFARWSRDLENSEGFQGFIEYVDRVSPEALRTLASLGDALLEIVEAAAPVGEASLPIIRALSNVIGAIADSPAGSVLIATAAGLSAISRAVAVYNVANGSAIGGLFGKLSMGRRAALGAGAMGLALGDIADNSTTAGKSVNTLSSALSGAAIGFGVGGPWGAAIGGAAGALIDLSAGSDSAGQSMRDTKQYAQDLAASFDQVTGAVTRSTRALILTDLRENEPNMIKGLNQIGVATRDITGAIAGSEGSIRRLNAALRKSGDEMYTYADGSKVPVEALAISLEYLQKDFGKTAAAARRNIEDTKTWRQALEGLPKKVFTELKAQNFDATFRDVARLRREYDLTPKQVGTLFKALGITEARGGIKNLSDAEKQLARKHDIEIGTPGIGKAKDDISGLAHLMDLTPDKKEVKTSTPGAVQALREMGMLDKQERDLADKHEVKTSAPGAKQAKKDIEGVSGAIGDMFGKTVGLDLSSNAKSVVSQVADALNVFNADGNVIEFYANGGTRHPGDVANSHEPQIVRAGVNRVFGEPETHGEGYVPFNPAKRVRSRALTEQIVNRLGGGEVIWNRDGNVLVQADTSRSKLRKRHPERIDADFADFAKGLSERLSEEMNKVLESMTVGMHWPLPRQYSYSGTWGSYESGGSHPALDFPAPRGTSIFSVLPGRVLSTTSIADSYGNHTEVSHGKGLTSLYAHQQRFDTKPGERVMAGERIGFVNSTGNSTGDHLHLEMRRNGNSFDYTNALNQGAAFGFPGQYEGNHDGLDRASPSQAQAYARSIMGRYGWPDSQWPYWLDLGNRESGWRWNALNPSSGAYGIPQSLPAEKMASSGSDWRTNAGTQLDWMAGYIRERYDGPHGAINWHNAHNWYADGAILDALGARIMDTGGRLRHGQVAVNLSGQDETVLNPASSRLIDDLVDALNHVTDGGRRRSNLIQPWNSNHPNRGGGGGGRFHAPDLERRAERELRKAERDLDRAKARVKFYDKGVARAEKRLDEAKGAAEKAEAESRLRQAEQRLKDAEKRRDRAERDRDRAEEDRKTAKQDQKRLDRAFDRFDIKPGMDRSEVKAEVSELMQAVKDTLGKDSRLFKSLDKFRDRLVDAAKRIDEERQERQKLNDQLKATRQAQRDFASSVSGNFKNDPFTGGLDEFYLQTRADRNDANRFNRLRNRGDKLGLDGPLMKAILASGNVELLAELVNSGRGEIRKAENAYERSRRDANQLGKRSGVEVYGEQIRKQNQALNQQNHLIKKLENKIDNLGGHVENGAEKGVHKGMKDRIQGMNLRVREASR